MGTPPSILIVHADTAAAARLKDELEHNGYQVVITSSGAEALRTSALSRFDLALVDLALPNPPGAVVARRLRQRHPYLRLMVLAPAGEDVPAGLTDLGIEGVLPRTSSSPQWAQRAREVLEQTVVSSAAHVAPPLTQAGLRLTREGAREWVAHALKEISALSSEIGAVALLLVWEGEMLGYAGAISSEEANGWASTLLRMWNPPQSVGTNGICEQLDFRSHTNGSPHILYSFALTQPAVVLSIALHPNAALGLVRRRARRVVERLRQFLSEVKDARA